MRGEGSRGYNDYLGIWQKKWPRPGTLPASQCSLHASPGRLHGSKSILSFSYKCFLWFLWASPSTHTSHPDLFHAAACCRAAVNLWELVRFHILFLLILFLFQPRFQIGLEGLLMGGFLSFSFFSFPHRDPFPPTYSDAKNHIRHNFKMDVKARAEPVCPTCLAQDFYGPHDTALILAMDALPPHYLIPLLSGL